MSASILFRAVCIGAAIVLASRAAPAGAQSAGARTTASVTVVERVGIAPGAATVARARSGHLDVTTPLAIHGRAATVVHVVEADLRSEPHPRPTASLRPTSSAEQPTAYTARIRIPPTPRSHPAGARAVTYVVSTVN